MTNQIVEISRVRDLLNKSKNEIEAALPKHLSADRMLRIAMTEVRRTPKLLECDPRSLIGAVIQASQLGLEPGSALGHCYFVPFFNGKSKQFEIQLVPGYRGFLDLARRSGQCQNIVARAVYAGDEFEFEYGLEERLVHRPCSVSERGELTHCYAIAFLKDGGRQFEVMSYDEIEAIRKRSKAGETGPWQSDYEAMARKTVLRRLFKYLPVSIEMQKAVGLDEAAERGEQQNREIIDVESTAENAPAEPQPQKGHVHRVKAARSKDDVQKAQEKIQEPAPQSFDPAFDSNDPAQPGFNCSAGNAAGVK